MNLIQKILPPENWKTPVIILAGIFTGLLAYTFYISNAASYLSDDPETCINCHVMNPQYSDWAHSSHRNSATCNDCHVPHNNVFNKYYFKAMDGLRHATIFTLRAEPFSISIKDAGSQVVQENCIRCHEHAVGMEFLKSVEPGFSNTLKERRCVDCHRETPHLRVNSIASTPNALTSGPVKKRESEKERKIEI